MSNSALVCSFVCTSRKMVSRIGADVRKMVSRIGADVAQHDWKLTRAALNC